MPYEIAYDTNEKDEGSHHTSWSSNHEIKGNAFEYGQQKALPHELVAGEQGGNSG